MTTFLGHTKPEKVAHRPGTGEDNPVIPGIFFQGVDKSVPCLGSVFMTAFICQNS